MDENKMDEINITFPGNFSEKTIKNLDALFKSKGALVAKACGAEDVTVACTDTLVTFTLVNPADAMITGQAGVLFQGMLGLATRSKWISPKAKPTENERYTFRIFMIRCGLGGDAFRGARTALLARLPGDSAYLHGRPTESHTARYYSVLRPVSIGTYPPGHVVEGFCNFEVRTHVPEIGRDAWGYIDFAEPIPDAEAIQYDLVRA